jgi:hypothetical protein
MQWSNWAGNSLWGVFFINNSQKAIFSILTLTAKIFLGAALFELRMTKICQPF